MREHWEHIATLGRATGHVDKLSPGAFSDEYSDYCYCRTADGYYYYPEGEVGYPVTVQQPQQQEARRQREPAPAPPTETRIPPPSRANLQHVEVMVIICSVPTVQTCKRCLTKPSGVGIHYSKFQIQLDTTFLDVLDP